MVKAATIYQCNESFASEQHYVLVCVFAGATSGIGSGTIERIATLLNGQSPTFYVLGRSEARFASQRAKLESLNPSCKLIFKQAEFSLLANIDAVCKQIHEERVDILFMSPGLIPLNGPQCACLP